ncbi:radical SAM family heme chaperone HemW [Thermomicrobiaceae bacterium CFH 74404]|uniref:Heme chaperone HemW n=1 Tax=Thermalbibacter longus TaxID=2951981 RepID=A0AA41WDI5_9BACT|nr:radical SAM family heme chaperone HemW [Thermalbibacter longus]MCM8749108.1 radical SAM family heme chaperone HemW [Thermalbibacter longus]
MRAPLPHDAPLGLYIHIPFCARVCPYCDFNVYARQERLIPDYVEAVVREMDLLRERLGPVAVTTIYFGGGTPSLLPPESVARLVQAARERFAVAPDGEIDLEANPESAREDNLAGYRAAGVNRLSIGVQTLQARGLKVLGRAHKPHVPEQALAAARSAGFTNVNLDFIYGWPGQTLEDWERDLDTALSWQPEHLSLYALTLEAGTPMQRAVERRILTVPDDDLVAEMAELAEAKLAAAGWVHYEVSNWARRPALASRHNQIYWKNGRYIGLGAGAHAYLGNTRSSNERLPARYIELVREGRLPVVFEETIDPPTEMAETMILGLRLLEEGISAEAFATRHGRTLEEVYGQELRALAERGLLEWDGERVRVSRDRWLLVNEIAVWFVPETVTSWPAG